MNNDHNPNYRQCVNSLATTEQFAESICEWIWYGWDRDWGNGGNEWKRRRGGRGDWSGGWVLGFGGRERRGCQGQGRCRIWRTRYSLLGERSFAILGRLDFAVLHSKECSEFESIGLKFPNRQIKWDSKAKLLPWFMTKKASSCSLPMLLYSIR